MKKTVFVGKVNDQEFDNVNDYNACVQAMLDMGENFQASSSTQVVDIPDIENDECDVCCGCCDRDCDCDCDKTHELRPSVDFLPGSTLFPTGEYIDTVVNVDDDTFKAYMIDVEKRLQCEYNRIYEALPHNNMDQLTTYTKAIEEIMGILNKDSGNNDTALENVYKDITDLENELNKLYDKQNLLERASDVIELWTDFYTDVYDEVKLYIHNNFDTDSDVQTQNKKSKVLNDIFKMIFGDEFK